MWSINLDASISEEDQTPGGHSGRPSEELGGRATRLGAPTTGLGAPRSAGTTLGAPQITVKQAGKNNIFFGNAAGAPGNHSYYISFNNV